MISASSDLSSAYVVSPNLKQIRLESKITIIIIIPCRVFFSGWSNPYPTQLHALLDLLTSSTLAIFSKYTQCYVTFMHGKDFGVNENGNIFIPGCLLFCFWH